MVDVSDGADVTVRLSPLKLGLCHLGSFLVSPRTLRGHESGAPLSNGCHQGLDAQVYNPGAYSCNAIGQAGEVKLGVASQPRLVALVGETRVPGIKLLKLSHSPLMSATFKLGAEESFADLQSNIRPDDTRAKGQDIRIVVTAAHRGRVSLGDAGRPDPLRLVGGDGDSDTGTTDRDPQIEHARGHLSGEPTTPDGVVGTLPGRRATIHDVVAQVPQPGDQVKT